MAIDFEALITAALEAGIDRFVVGAVIFNAQASTLILTRQADDFMGGIDEIPSGKVDPGESLTEALVREVKEEAGLDIEIQEYLDFFDYRSKSGKATRQFNFLARSGSFDVKTNPEEHDGFRWVAKDELDNYKITEPVKTTIRLAYADMHKCK